MWDPFDFRASKCAGLCLCPMGSKGVHFRFRMSARTMTLYFCIVHSYTYIKSLKVCWALSVLVGAHFRFWISARTKVTLFLCYRFKNIQQDTQSVLFPHLRLLRPKGPILDFEYLREPRDFIFCIAHAREELNRHTARASQFSVSCLCFRSQAPISDFECLWGQCEVTFLLYVSECRMYKYSHMVVTDI